MLAMLGILVVGGLVFLGARSYGRWQRTHYFGEVVRMVNGSIVISDIEVGERLVDLDERTVIRRGRQIQPTGLQVGDLVIVVGDKKADGHIGAFMIRIVEDKKRGP